MGQDVRTPLTRRQIRTVTLGVVVVAALGLGGIALLGGPDTEARIEPAPPLTVSTLSVERQDRFSYQRRFVGRIEAARESSVGFELGGLVVDVRADDGDRVRRGQVVARLDTARLEARRAELAAALDEAIAGRELADSTRTRVQLAHEKNAVSTQRLDEAERQYQAAFASVRRAEAALASIDVDIDKATLRAPYDAIVARRFVDEGQVIAGGRPVLTLLERRHPEARIGVAEDAIGSLEPGQSKTVTVNGRTFPATVRAIVPQRDERSRSVDVLLTLDAALDELKRGDLAEVAIDTVTEDDGFWLPLGALTEGARGLWSCFVAEPVDGGDGIAAGTHRLSRRELVILHQEEDRVFVRGTLQDGELVVRDGRQRLAPRLAVRVEDAS